MPDLHADRAAWITRVLGVGISRPGAPDGQDRGHAWRQARDAWEQASDSVDQQVSALQRILRETDDPELHDIAEYGLNAMTGGFKTAIRVALLEAGETPPESGSQQAVKALVALRGLRDAIAGDMRVAACDNNPGGVQVSIRATLLPALDRMQAALA